MVEITEGERQLAIMDRRLRSVIEAQDWHAFEIPKSARSVRVNFNGWLGGNVARLNKTIAV